VSFSNRYPQSAEIAANYGHPPGTQTLGEEYVEIYPYANRQRNFPSKLVREDQWRGFVARMLNGACQQQRRIASIAVLIGAPYLFNHIIESLASHAATPTDDGRPTRRQVLVKWLKSTWVKALPELWFAWFLVKGRNMEWTKSLMGMSYVRII